MKKLLLLLALVTTPVVAQQTPQQPGVAIDTAAARVIVAAWRRQPGDSIACLYGTSSASIIVIDSAKVEFTCGGPQVIGLFGFIPNDQKYEQQEIQRGMAHVLKNRPDLRLTGAVYGATPVNMDGQIHWSPRVWAVVRRGQ